MIRPADLIAAARHLLSAGRGAARDAHLRRAVSTAYYAAFHALAGACAEAVVGPPGKGVGPEARDQVYRALDHGPAKEACIAASAKDAPFAVGVREFAGVFAKLQLERHAADYDPGRRLTPTEAAKLVEEAEAAIRALRAAPARDRRELAVRVLFRRRAR